ncbi:poly [ADP-ribose] polymerase tankyrase-1-like [Schistocerca nitens]|uniref:poly [ADP-ribose] polymerase tankyrase-1-like n=1 Tax=Schistocerca nitens TaxID=7011 RepID=UPI00211972C7|nr:poly [ADP-ribose] polymerase tankyrase-1-like [Schistocerca nitens]XP_049795990.1 poly [ADP-ribose] polymerase tankyrase-1-like [Schistocerca nitens]XP_049795991.1 poly [ADP-ribose] polymerase tankyrase-1-like [Schistocerca nitens]XP_049795992.1 poly [ADP-ribose] polymerase tankyrase-1-like [Schistocerca nitens]
MSAVTEVQNTTTEALAALVDGGEDGLVTLVAGETRVAAHRAVLAAASPVFAAMFAHDMLEASCGQVSVDDVEGPVLRLLVAYTYTLQAPQLPDTAHQLLAAAEKYGLSALKAACERQLISQLAVETAAATAVTAVRHSCPDATRAAVAFIKDHLQVIATRGWADALLEYPQEVIEVCSMLGEPPAEASLPTAAGGGSIPNSDRQPRSGHSRTPAAAAPPMSARHTPPPDDAAVSRFRAPAVTELSTTTRTTTTSAAAATSASAPRQTPAAARPTSTQPDEATVSQMRSLSAEERDRRLVQAAKQQAVGELRALIAAGADVAARDGSGRTALHCAAGWGDVEAARLLVGAGAAVDARTDGGWTPLHCAAANGHAEVAAALLVAGADRGATTGDGRTALDVARRCNQRRLVEML